MRTMKGFTLIELMIVVAIFAILAAIFFPMWRDRNLTDFEKQQRRAQFHAELERKYGEVGVRCIGGYKFAQPDITNPPVQIKDNNGNGILCQ